MKNLNYHKLNASKIICKLSRTFIPTKRKVKEEIFPKAVVEIFDYAWFDGIAKKYLFGAEREPSPQLSLLLYWCLHV